MSDTGDLIVVIPGILGSRLERVRGGKRTRVWDLSVTGLPRALWNIKRDDALLVPGGPDEDPSDRVEAVGLIDVPQWLPDFFGVDGYTDLVERLRKSLQQQVIEFPYDWRLSNAYSAARLKSVVDSRLRELEQRGAKDPKAVLVCHSMGGLVARYYCEALGGAGDVRSLITIATPHRGSMRALDALVNGKRLAHLVDLSKELRSLDSVYELLPQFPCLETDGKLSKVDELIESMPTVAPARFTAAAAFHAAIRQPAEDRAQASEPSPYEQMVFSNRRQSTPLGGLLHGRRLELFDYDVSWDGGVRREVRDRAGDGTVPWFSALPFEWDDDGDVISVGEKHAATQTAISVVDTILNKLAPGDARQKKGIGIDDGAVIRLDVPAVVERPAGGPALAEIAVHADRPGRLAVSITNCESGTSTELDVLPPGGATTTAKLPEQGVHRVVARPARPSSDLQPVSDYVLVVDPAGELT